MKQDAEQPSAVYARLAEVRQALGLNQEAFAALIGLSRAHLSNIERGKRGVPFEVITFLIETRGVSAYWFHTGKGPMFGTSTPINGQPNGHVNGHPIDQGRINHVSNDAEEPTAPPLKSARDRLEIIVATQDTHGNPTYIVVNHKAAANYLNGYQSQEYIEHLGAVTLPRVLVGSSRQGIFFQIEGDSMLPRFQHNDWVACTLLDRSEWHQLRDNECYVVVSDTYGIQFKRVRNRLTTPAHAIRCTSDNRRHRPYNIEEPDLLQLFRFVLHVSPDSTNPDDAVYQKVDHLEDVTTDLREMYEQMLQRLQVVEKATQPPSKDQENAR